MRRSLPTFLLLAALLAAPARGGEALEITPFVGYRFGGGLDAYTGESYNLDSASSYGLGMDLPLGDGTSMLELFWSRQETEVRTGGIFEESDRFDLTLDSYQVGVVYELDEERVRPFLVASLGATRFEIDRGSVSDSTVFALTVGGGAKLFLGDHVGIRLEGRVYAPFVGGSTGVACSGGGGGGSCFLSFSGNVLWQLELGAGVIVAF